MATSEGSRWTFGVGNLLWKAAVGVGAGVAVCVAFSIWADARGVSRALASFSWTMALAALSLALANYLVRFLRWHHYLKVLGLRQVGAVDSLLAFLGGFALTVTPGKVGEAVKALMLRKSHGIPAARTAPIVLAERFTDLIGLLFLAGVGAFTFEVDRRFLVTAALLLAAGLVVVSVRPVAGTIVRLGGSVPGVRCFAHKLEEAHEAAAALLRPAPLAAAVLLSIASWFFECVAFWLVVRGFPGAGVGMHAATFIFAAMSIAGALSFLPGGLGVTEAGMLALLAQLGTGVDRSIGAAAIVVIRATTLWFAVILGLGALFVFVRRAVRQSGSGAASPAPSARHLTPP
jgi:uncharacterized membrane protein YbhN (UPF0104 family)